MEELGAGELLDELDELPTTEPQAPGVQETQALPVHASVVEVPVVLDRSLFTGNAPVEIKLKLYLK